MSRKLLIGPIEYAWPNDGDLDWGQDVFDWAEAISKVATENVQSRVPSGGDGGQILAKSGDADYALHWINPPSGGGSGGGTTYTAGSGLTLSAANQFRIMDGSAADQILVFDGSAWTLEAKPSGSTGVEDLSGVKGGSGITVTHTESNTVATVAVTNSIQTALVPTGGRAGQVLTKNSGTDHDLDWTTVSGGGSGSGYEGPADLNVVEISNLGVNQLTEADHLNTIIAVNNSADSTRSITATLPAASSLSTTDLRFFCRIYVIDSGSNVDIQVTAGDTLTTTNPINGRTADVTTFVYVGNSQALAKGQYVDIYSVDGEYQALGPTRTSEERNSDISNSGGTTYTAGIGLTLSNTNQFSIGTDQIINSMMQDDSIEQSNIWATANATTGQVLTAHSDGTRFVWRDLPSGGSGSYAGPADLDVVKISALGSTVLTEADHLNKLIELNNTATGSSHIKLILPPAESLSTTDVRFFCRLYVTSNNNSVEVQSTRTNQIEVSNPYRGPFGRISSFFIGNSRLSALGQHIDIYTSGGDYQVFGPLRRTEDEDVNALVGGEGITVSNRTNISLTDNAIEYKKLINSYNWVDNAGSIDRAVGFETMGLIFKQSTSIGSNNAEWVPTDFGTLFELQSAQIGTDPNTAQHNYGLHFQPGVIKSADIRQIDDLDNLIGITFVRGPATVNVGQPLRTRLTKPWVQENEIFDLSSTLATITIPRKRTKNTRSITHMLVKLGRISGVTDATSRTDIINSVQRSASVYHEILVPVISSYGKANGTNLKAGIDNYNGLFAAGVSCSIQLTTDNTTGEVFISADLNDTSTSFNGDEFIAVYAVRAIGG